MKLKWINEFFTWISSYIFQSFNGHRGSGKRANSFWQLSLDTNRNFSCVYTVVRQARSSDCIDTVLSMFKFIIYMYIAGICQSFDPVQLEKGLYFPKSSSNYFFFISLSFLIIFLNFEVKKCANIYWKYDNTGFAMEKRSSFVFIFQNGQYPIWRQNKTHCVVIKLSILGTWLLFEVKMTLYMMTVLVISIILLKNYNSL